jgi:hypothetical protein
MAMTRGVAAVYGPATSSPTTFMGESARPGVVVRHVLPASALRRDLVRRRVPADVGLATEPLDVLRVVHLERRALRPDAGQLGMFPILLTPV